MSITRMNPRLWIAVVALLAAVVLLPGRAHVANVIVNLCATSGSISVPAAPAAVSVPILGYVAGDCSTTATAPARGGPVVAVNVGDVVTVNLRNNLGEPTGLLFQGQSCPTWPARRAGRRKAMYSRRARRAPTSTRRRCCPTPSTRWRWGCTARRFRTACHGKRGVPCQYDR